LKKVLVIATLCAVLSSMFAGTAALAAPGGKDTPANDNPQNLYLYPKEYADAPEWTTLWEHESWGKYNFKMKGTEISGPFNGHGLAADTEYTLISYNDPWAADPQFVVIGSGTSDGNGNIHISGSADLGEDVASPEYDWNGPGDGYKIWLVLTADIDTEASQFTAWNPDSYLFENNRIGCTETAPEE
jgi:hypothetical protein